jgi:hypothetical protein
MGIALLFPHSLFEDSCNVETRLRPGDDEWWIIEDLEGSSSGVIDGFKYLPPYTEENYEES